MDRVGPEYFRTARIDLLRGRMFDNGDDRERVVVLDEEAALQFFPDGRDPLGGELEPGPDELTRTIIGVVRAVNANGPEAARSPHVYFPREPGERGNRVLVRTSRPPAAVTPALVNAMASILPAGVQAPDVQSLEEAFSRITTERRFNTALMSLFGIVALLIGATGVYAVMNANVAKQRRELGIRVALGASRSQLVAGVVRRALWLTTLGLVVGLAAGRALAAWCASLLFGVGPGDPATYAIVVVLLGSVGLAAAALPARRAAIVDPLVVLRSE
jgi:hypothetical protein